MQIVLLKRYQFYDLASFESPTVDVSGMAMIVIGVTVHSVSGTSPQLSVQLQSSDDGDTFANVGTAVDVSAASFLTGAVLASSAPYGRYVRLKYDITGTDPLVNATVTINTFPSS